MLVKYNVKNENLSLYIFINMSSEMIGYEVEEEEEEKEEEEEEEKKRTRYTVERM